jgi:hypothetical protein
VSPTNEFSTKTAWAWRVLVGIEAQLDFLPHQFRPNFPVAALEADGAILAHATALAMQKHLGEVLRAWDGAQEGQLGKPVFTRHPAGGVVWPGVIFPRPATPNAWH